METPPTTGSGWARENRRTIIIVLLALAACCACLIAAAIAWYSWNAVPGGQPQSQPDGDLPGVTPNSDFGPTFEAPEAGADLGEAPTGGLGDETLRSDTWQFVASDSIGQGCDEPLGADTTIEVVQEPDANGMWVEEWTVACSSGDTFSYEVEYIPDATGTTFNIRPLP